MRSMEQTDATSESRPAWTRRTLLSGALTGAVAATALGTRSRSARGADGVVELPPDVGQSPSPVYVPETGHTVRGVFLDYWRANGAASVLGNPLTEPFDAPNGYYSQAFERGILQYRPEFLWTEEPIVRLMPIHSREYRRTASGLNRADRREGGGGNGRGPAWVPLPPESGRVSRVLADGGLYFEETGHTLRGSFLEWYDGHEGHFYLGHPVSESYTERGAPTQYFEGGRLIETDDGVRLAPIDRELVRDLRLDTKPVDQGGAPAFEEALFWEAPNPNPLGSPDAPGRKLIEISLADQRMWAYQGDTLITSSLVSTGLSPNDTETGTFRLRLKYLEQDMQGFTDSTGEVLGTGDAPPGTIPYAVEDVPHVMYFNLEAEALHGAYWHNNFGNPMSHGCVNQPLDVAAFMFGWAPIGTAVWVHE